MKKLRIVVIIFILAFSFSVKAEVLLDIDCNSADLTVDKSITCEGILMYAREGINDIEFNYRTNLNISFLNVKDFSFNESSGKVRVHTDKTLYDRIMNATKIIEFTLSVNDNINEQETLVIDNIMINKSDDIKVEPVTKEFNVVVPINELDDVCTLDSITVEKEEVKNFNKDVFEYQNINVTNEIIFIDAIRTSDKSIVTGLGNVRVPKGKTIEREITVTAEDNSKNVYKLYITNISEEELEDEFVLEKPIEIEKSSDNTLKLLEIYNGKKKIELLFDKDKTIYNIDINDKVDKLTIKASLNDSKSSFIKNYGPRDIKIKYGYNKELIKIKAENDDERTITININYVDNRDKDNTLKSLIINNQVVDLNKLEVIVENNVLKTIIEVIPSSDKATVKYNDVDLLVGDNDIIIQVTSEFGETKEYKVNVIRKEEEIILPDIIDEVKEDAKVIVSIPKENNSINTICYVVFGIGVLLLISSIIYVKKRHYI